MRGHTWQYQNIKQEKTHKMPRDLPWSIHLNKLKHISSINQRNVSS